MALLHLACSQQAIGRGKIVRSPSIALVACKVCSRKLPSKLATWCATWRVRVVAVIGCLLETGSSTRTPRAARAEGGVRDRALWGARGVQCRVGASAAPGARTSTRPPGPGPSSTLPRAEAAATLPGGPPTGPAAARGPGRVPGGRSAGTPRRVAVTDGNNTSPHTLGCFFGLPPWLIHRLDNVVMCVCCTRTL